MKRLFVQKPVQLDCLDWTKHKLSIEREDREGNTTSKV